MAESIGELAIELRAQGEKLASDINRHIGQAQSQVSTKAVALGSVIAAGITAGLASIGSVIKSTISESLNLAASFETTTTQFKVLLGDLGKANDMISGMRKLDQSSPLSFTNLTDAGKTLLGFGASAESILPTLRMLGDVSLGNGEKFKSLTLAFAQTQAAGRLMGQEVLQFVNAGFNPLQQISLRTGESMLQLKQRMEDAKIPFSEVQQAFIDATSAGGRFFGGMEEGAKTMDGIKAKLSGTADQLKADFGAGLNNALKPVFQELAGLLSALAPSVRQIGIEIGAWTTSTLSAAGGLTGIASAIANVAQYVNILRQAFETVGVTIGAGIAVFEQWTGVMTKGMEVAAVKITNVFRNIVFEVQKAVTESINKILTLANTAAKKLGELVGTTFTEGEAQVAENAFARAATLPTAGPNPVLPDYDLPSVPGGGETLFGMLEMPEAPKEIMVDYTGLGDQVDIFKETTKEAFRVVGAEATQAGDEIAKAFTGDTWGKTIEENYKKQAAASTAAAATEVQNTTFKNAAIVNSEVQKAGQVAEVASQQANAQVTAANEAGRRIQQANVQTYDSFREVGQRTIGDLVTSWATGTGRISDIVSQWANNMIQQFIQVSLFGNKSGGGSIGGLLSGFSGMGTAGAAGGGWASALGSIVGGFFADGGRPPMGKVSVVGERGPELFVPDSAGKIIPNTRMASFAPAAAGGGGEMSQPIIINQTFQSGVGRAELAGMMDDMMEQTKGAVAEGVRRGGSFRRSVQS